MEFYRKREWKGILKWNRSLKNLLVLGPSLMKEVGEPMKNIRGPIKLVDVIMFEILKSSQISFLVLKQRVKIFSWYLWNQAVCCRLMEKVAFWIYYHTAFKILIHWHTQEYQIKFLKCENSQFTDSSNEIKKFYCSKYSCQVSLLYKLLTAVKFLTSI